MKPEHKKLIWGEGPWVDEPDHEEFEHAGFHCEVERKVSANEKEISFIIEVRQRLKKEQPENPLLKCLTIFGGHLCGYVKIPKNHPWYDREDIDCCVHGGITYTGTNEKGEFMIGFDCAHLYDITPSMEIQNLQMMEISDEYRKIHEMQDEFEKRLKSTGPEKTYKPFLWVIEETKRLAEQAAKAKEN